MQLTRLAVVRPLTVLMGLLGLVIMGGVSYTFLKIDRLPPISIPFVSVSMAYTGATAQDVELLITEPIENAVSGMSGVYSITSTSSEGSASVIVQLVDGTDPTQASLEVERRVNAIRSKLPADASDPRVNKSDPNAQPIMEVALTGGKPDQLFEIANDQFVPAARVGAWRRQHQHLGRPADRSPGPDRLLQAGGVRHHPGQHHHGADQRQRRRAGRLDRSGRPDAERPLARLLPDGRRSSNLVVSQTTTGGPILLQRPGHRQARLQDSRPSSSA